MPDLYSATEAARERFERRLIPQTRSRLEEAAGTFARAASGARRPEGAILRAQMAADKPDLAIDVLEMIYRPVTAAFANAARSGVAAMKQSHDDDWLQRVRRFLLTEGAEMVRAITDTTREDVRRILTEGAEEGLGVEAMARKLEAEWEDLARVRSRRIVRTEVIAASNQGTTWGAEVAAEQAGMKLKKEWIASPGGRTRQSHAAADGQVVNQNESFDVGGFAARYPGDPSLPASERINCFPASEVTHVDPSTVKRAFRAPYEGQLIRLELASGHKVSVTPNHPILTVRGWVKAGSMEEGMSLVKPAAVERSVTGFHVQNVPSTIEQVANSIGEGSVSVGSHAVDFYGDRPHGDVDVIRADGFLHDGSDVSAGERRRHTPFTRSELGKRALFVERLLARGSMEERSGLLPDSSMRRFSVGDILFVASLLHHKAIRFGVAPSLDASLPKTAHNDLPAYPERVGKAVLRLAALVSLYDARRVNRRAAVMGMGSNRYAPLLQPGADGGDTYAEVLSNIVHTVTGAIPTNDVVNVEVISHWNGTVYTLETTTGMYEISGLVAKNCRCSLAFLPADDSTRTWRQERNEAIRSAYPDLRDREGKWGAIGVLAEKHLLSERTIEDVIYRQGYYAQ